MFASCVPPYSSRFTPSPWWSFPSPPSCCCPNEAAPSAYMLHCESQQLNTVKLILTGNEKKGFFFSYKVCGFFSLQGPFVQVDELMESFRRCTLPESKLLLSALKMNTEHFYF